MRSAWLLFLPFVVACGASVAMRAAERGDVRALHTELLARERAGTMTNVEAADLARAVATREIEQAKGGDAALRVREVRGCAADLDSVLERRARQKDNAGAEAAMARLEDREMSRGSAREHANDEDDAWRAVGARGLVRDEDHAARVHAIVDPSPAVRRAAVHAIAESGDAAATYALFDAARLDPEPLVRTEAVRAIARIAPADPDVVTRLRDLWTSGDDPVREDIARAWASGKLYATGGRDALRIVLAAETGPAILEAAAAVLDLVWTTPRQSLGRAVPPARDAVLDASATAVLARGVRSGSLRNRLHAIAIAPVRQGAAGEPILVALRDAAHEKDLEIAVAASARLTESPPDRVDAVRALEMLAGPGDHARVASRARLALAGAGDTRVQAWIEQDLGSDSAPLQLEALDALASLGKAGRGAPLLADADPGVRTRAACTLLTAGRTGR